MALLAPFRALRPVPSAASRVAAVPYDVVTTEEARAQAEASRHDLRRQLNYMVARRPRADETGRQIRRALVDWRNLAALAKRRAARASGVDSECEAKVRMISGAR